MKWPAWLSVHRRPHSPLDLLAPPLLSEVVVHVKADGARMTFMSKNEISPAQMVHVLRSVVEAVGDLTTQHAAFLQQPGVAEIVMAMTNGGVNLGQKYGMQLNFKQGEPHGQG